MNPAFLQFSDPYAWLIRGMVEADWQDLSLESYQVLPQKPVQDLISNTSFKLVVDMESERVSWQLMNKGNGSLRIKCMVLISSLDKIMLDSLHTWHHARTLDFRNFLP